MDNNTQLTNRKKFEHEVAEYWKDYPLFKPNKESVAIIRSAFKHGLDAKTAAQLALLK